jgi:FtsP/CotA-like multicopper oxidase with cupredoxin domain
MKSSPDIGTEAHATTDGPDNGAHGPHGDDQSGAMPSHHGMQDLRGKGDSDSFPRDPTGLPEASPVTSIELSDGATFDLVAAPVRKHIGDATVKMLGYGGSVPGPTLRVPQGAEVTVRFLNGMDLETTVHWHGLRHENRFDGVPTGPHGGMQAPVKPGETFTYRLQFPDAGIFWYHPHMREDYGQEQGLYGSIVVEPTDPFYWPSVNRELSLMVDDILMEEGQVAAFGRSASDHTAMGRYGNVMLLNGETDFRIEALVGEVVRLFIVNAANTRVFNLAIPGAALKLVGGDNGRLENETFVEEVLIAPSERAVVDVLFEHPGELNIEHRTPNTAYPLGTVHVTDTSVDRSYTTKFTTARTSPELEEERVSIALDLERAPDKTLSLVGVMPGMAGHGHTPTHSEEHAPAIEWEDTMEPMNRMSTPQDMIWRVVDQETGADNHDIDWTFQLGDRAKIRILNTTDSGHPMQHPFHIHGQRFLVLSRDGTPNSNLAWKDTVLVQTGETVDILMDASNPGLWMAHCHIAEHLEGGMMFTFEIVE